MNGHWTWLNLLFGHLVVLLDWCKVYLQIIVYVKNADVVVIRA